MQRDPVVYCTVKKGNSFRVAMHARIESVQVAHFMHQLQDWVSSEYCVHGLV